MTSMLLSILTSINSNSIHISGLEIKIGIYIYIKKCQFFYCKTSRVTLAPLKAGLDNRLVLRPERQSLEEIRPDGGVVCVMVWEGDNKCTLPRLGLHNQEVSFKIGISSE